MDTTQISHTENIMVYIATTSYQHPKGDFSQRQHGNYVKSINCVSLPKQIIIFPPGVQGDRHRNCYSLILHVENHTTEKKAPWQNLGPDAHCHYSWCFGGEKKRKTILHHFASCESLCGYSHTKNPLSYLLARSGPSLAYSLPVFLFASYFCSLENLWIRISCGQLGHVRSCSAMPMEWVHCPASRPSCFCQEKARKWTLPWPLGRVSSISSFRILCHWPIHAYRF